jgi:PAS domain S-box-containing protein
VRYLEVNSTFEKQTGLSQIIGKTERELGLNLEQSLLDIYNRVAVTGEAVRFETRVEAVDRWFDIYSYRVGGPGIRKVAVLFNNITARKRAERALRESEEHLRALVNQTIGGIAETNFTGRYTLVNERYCEIVGYTQPGCLMVCECRTSHIQTIHRAISNFSNRWQRQARRLKSKTVGYWNQRLIDYTGLTPEEIRQGGWVALHPDDVERVRAAWAVAFAQGTYYEVEQRIRGRDGSYRRFVCRGVPVRDEQGQLVEWFGTDIDVEERRRAEDERRKLLRLLIAAQEDCASTARPDGAGCERTGLKALHTQS